MKAGVCTIAMKDRSVVAAVETAARVGAGGVEIWGREPHLPSPADRASRVRLRTLLRDAGLEAVALGSYFRPDGITGLPGSSVREEERGEYVLAAARELGCPLVRIWCGRGEYEETPESRREAIYDDVRAFADAAGREGCRVVLERHNGTLTSSWVSALKVLDEIDHPGVSLCYQVPYPAPAQELRGRTADDFARLLPGCEHAHLQNYVERSQAGPEAPTDARLPRTLLAEGIVDYTLFGREAHRIAYDGWAMVEFPAAVRGVMSEDEALAADVAFIVSL